jgi:hypothetical protein
MYKIVLVSNKKRSRILYRTNNEDDAYIEFATLIQNNKVYFPKKKITSRDILNNTQYEILLVKKRRKVRDKDVKNRMVRNELNQLVEETIKSKKWIILNSNKYFVEEKFYVYGYCYVKERFTVKRIIKEIIMRNIRRKFMIKQIVLIKNKILIESDYDDFDLIICKDAEDGTRLYNILRSAIYKTKIKNILFLGRPNLQTLGMYHKKIMDKTGWNHQKVRRVSTCH